LIFTIYPIIAIFYYSFTNYQPLEAQKFNNPVYPSESLEFNLGYFQNDVGPDDYDQLLSSFEPVSFIQYDVGVNLDEEQKESIKRNFNSEKLIKDFVNGELPEKMTVSEFMKKYMITGFSAFLRYIPDFVGFDNFKRMFNDQYFYISLWNAVLFSLIVVPAQTLLAIILAVAANSKIKGKNIFKVIFFIPAITSSAAISMIFWLIYSKPGILNRVLVSLFGGFGYQPIDFLNEPNIALYSIMAMNIWTTAGYFMITFLAGLQDIPKSIYEAADIDGAKGWTKFWKITMPLLRPQILFVMIMSTIGTLQVFDQIYFLIKNMRNITISFYIYKNAFEYGEMGYASSLAVVLFGVILFITFIQRKYIKEEY
jgi:ABC-type sugar transport system permease subunit